MRANAASWIALVVALAIAFHYYHEPWTMLRFAGAVVGGAALVMLSVARYQLGRSFALRAQARHLVTTGIYARIRNPIYVAGELFLLGAAIFLPSWIPAVLVVVTVPIQWVRARNEAKVLHAAFGTEYEAYRRGTWF